MYHYLHLSCIYMVSRINLNFFEKSIDSDSELYIMADFRDVDDKLMTAEGLMRFLVEMCMREYIYRSREAVLKVETGY
jgi:hypothetical protein